MFATEGPIVTTRVARLIISGVSILGLLSERSIPFSFITSTATGFTRLEGIVPALEPFKPYFFAKASTSGSGWHSQHRQTRYLYFPRSSTNLNNRPAARAPTTGPIK